MNERIEQLLEQARAECFQFGSKPAITLGYDELEKFAELIVRDRLAQPEQEPFGYFHYAVHLDAWVQNRDGDKGVPFYINPLQRTWAKLTVREIEWCFDDANNDLICAARNIEAKLKEKNT